MCCVGNGSKELTALFFLPAFYTMLSASLSRPTACGRGPLPPFLFYHETKEISIKIRYFCHICRTVRIEKQKRIGFENRSFFVIFRKGSCRFLFPVRVEGAHGV